MKEATGNLVLEQALHEQRTFAAFTDPGFKGDPKAVRPYLERAERAKALLAELERLRGTGECICKDCGIRHGIGRADDGTF